MSQHPAPLTRRQALGLPAHRHRARRATVAHRPEREQPRHRRQPQIDRRRRQHIGPPAVETHHVRAARPASHPLLAARGHKPQQHIGRHCRQVDALTVQPTTERQQPEPVGADRARRIVPIRQIRQVLVHQPEPAGPVTNQAPTSIAPTKHQPALRHSHICNAQRTLKQALTSPNSQTRSNHQTLLAG